MKFALKYFLFLFLMSQLFFYQVKAAEENKIYLIPLNYNKGEISFGEISTKLGYVPPSDDQTKDKSKQYLIELISFSNKVLESKNFSFSLLILPVPPLPDEKIMGLPAMLDKTTELIIFPYYKDGRKIKVYDSDKKLILSKDIAYLSDVCGDGICQPHESYVDCPKDCPAAGKDDYCNLDQVKTDPDCQKIVATDNTKKVQAKSIFSGKAIYFILFIILLIMGSSYLIYKKRYEPR